MIISFMLYHKRSNGNYIFDVPHATTISQPLKDARMQQLYAVDHKDDGNECMFLRCIARSNKDDLTCVMLQEATLTMVDCDKGMQDCTKQQPKKLVCSSQEQVTITKQ
jgi:hypothetical protein